MAATDLERLVVQLSADIRGYENSLKRAQGVTNQRLGSLQKRALASSSAISGAFVKTGAQIAAAFAASAITRNIGQLSDSATRIDNALKVAGLSGEELERVYQKLNKAALANGAPIETLASLYGKAAQAQKELGVTSDELLGFTNNVALALRVAGTDAQSASGALLQLGQALGSGKVQAEEFNSVLEGAPTIVQAVAAGLKEAGGSVSQLKQLIVDGKVSSEAFFRAFEAGAPILQEKVAGSVFTIEQASTNLWTALINVAREFNSATGASQNFAGGINAAASAVNGFDISGLIEQVSQAKSELEGLLGALGNAQIFKDLNELLGVTDGDGNIINLDATEAKDETASLEKEVKTLQDRIALNTSLGFDNTEALARLGEVQAALANVRAAAANMPATVPSITIKPGSVANINAPTFAGKNKDDLLSSQPAMVKPVSLGDFKPPPSRGGGGGRRGGGGGGSGSSGDDLQREIRQIQERTAAIRAETAAQAGLNPVINDYGFAIEKARTTQELLTAAQEAGKAVTPQLKAQIDTLATGYAAASAEAEKLAQQQENTRRLADDFRGAAQDALGGFISDLRNGESAADALGNALDRIADRLLDMALNSIFDGMFGGGGGGGGFLGNLFGGGASQFSLASSGGLGLYDKGGFTGQGGKYQPAGIVHKGEYVFDAEAVKRIGVRNLRRLQGYANGGLVGGGASIAGRASTKGDGVTVNVINNSSAQIKQQSRQTSNGTQIDVLVDEMVADKMATPGSRSRGAMQSQFGLRGGLARR